MVAWEVRGGSDGHSHHQYALIVQDCRLLVLDFSIVYFISLFRILEHDSHAGSQVDINQSRNDMW